MHKGASHLGEKGKGKEQCKAKAINEGLVSELDIEGTDEADKLAKEGVERHDINKHQAAAARYREVSTVVAQRTMLHVWESYVESCSAKVKTELRVMMMKYTE